MHEATPDGTGNKTRGYSMPPALHQLIAKEAKRRDMNASQLVRKAVQFYLRAMPVENGPVEKAS